MMQAKCPLYVTRITNKQSVDALVSAKRRGATVYGESLASTLGLCVRGIKPIQQIYYVTSPPIRSDPEAPRQLIKSLAL